MNKGLEFIQFPVPDRTELVIATLAFLGLFVLAVVIEALRRRVARRRSIRQAWQEVDKIVAAKDLSEVEKRLLREVVDSACPDDPLGFVTVRRSFNLAVESFLERKKSDRAGFAKYGLLLRDMRTRLGLDFVPVGQLIETTRDIGERQLILARKAFEDRQRWFKLTVIRVDEAYLYAAVDFSDTEGARPSLRVGEELHCRMWKEDDARYAFKSVIVRLESVLTGTETAPASPAKPPAGVEQRPPDVVTLSHGTAFQRIQTRAHFRVRHNQPASIGIVQGPSDRDYADAGARHPITHLRGRIVNLSAGGLAVELPQSVPSHVLLRATLDLTDAEPVTVTARIVSVSPLGGGRHLVRGAFVDISEEMRDVIAQYVWRRQQPVPKRDDGAV